MLCIYRLKYLRSVILHVHPLPKQMLAYESSMMDPLSWAALIVSDLRRLRDTCTFLFHLPDPLDDPVAWPHFLGLLPFRLYPWSVILG